MRVPMILSVAAFGVLCASASQAQQAGTYTGTTQDGKSVTISVAHDPNNSNFEVTLVSFGVVATCRKSHETLSGVGIGLSDGQDIVNKKFSYTSQNFPATNLVTSMTFHGTQTVKGNVAVNFASFNPVFGHAALTKKIQLCVSPNQAFTATFSSADKAVLPPTAITITDDYGTRAIGFSGKN